MTIEAADILELLPGTQADEDRINLSTAAIEEMIAGRIAETNSDTVSLGYGTVEPWGNPKTCRDYVLEEIITAGVVADLLTSALVSFDDEAQGYARAFRSKADYMRKNLVRTHSLVYAFSTEELGELPTDPLVSAKTFGELTGVKIEDGAQIPPAVFVKIARRCSATIYPLLALVGFDPFSLTNEQLSVFGGLAAKLCAAWVLRAKSTAYSRAILNGPANTAAAEAMAIYADILNGEYKGLA